MIGLAVNKFAARARELSRGLVSEEESDFLDIKSPIFVAGALSVGVVMSILAAIVDWEESRY